MLFAYRNKQQLYNEYLEISSGFSGLLLRRLNVLGLYKSDRKICTRIIPFTIREPLYGDISLFCRLAVLISSLSPDYPRVQSKQRLILLLLALPAGRVGQFRQTARLLQCARLHSTRYERCSRVSESQAPTNEWRSLTT